MSYSHRVLVPDGAVLVHILHIGSSSSGERDESWRHGAINVVVSHALEPRARRKVQVQYLYVQDVYYNVGRAVAAHQLFRYFAISRD